MALIARKLIQEDISVKFSSFRDGLSYLRNSGFDCEEVPPIDIGWSAFSTRQSFPKLPATLLSFRRQVFHELSIIRRFKPSVVLSDSRLSSIIAASLLGVPSLAVLNQLRILIPRPTKIPFPRFVEDSAAEVLAYLWSAAERILVPDLPPPFTIAKSNIFGVRHTGKLRFTGFLFKPPIFERSKLDQVRNALGLGNGRPIIFALISGPSPTRARILEKAIEAAEDYSSEFHFIISMGVEHGSTAPQRTDWGILFEWCPFRDELMFLSDIILARAGHSVISQSILFGKPMLLVPIPSHSEQMANAARAGELGVATILAESAIASELGEQMRYLLTSTQVKGRVIELKSMAEKLSGIDLVTEEVMAML